MNRFLRVPSSSARALRRWMPVGWVPLDLRPFRAAPRRPPRIDSARHGEAAPSHSCRQHSDPPRARLDTEPCAAVRSGSTARHPARHRRHSEAAERHGDSRLRPSRRRRRALGRCLARRRPPRCATQCRQRTSSGRSHRRYTPRRGAETHRRRGLPPRARAQQPAASTHEPRLPYRSPARTESRPRRPAPGNCTGLAQTQPAVPLGSAARIPPMGAAPPHNAVSGGPGESHPRAPSDPGVTVSRHRALLTGSSVVGADHAPVGE